MEVRILPVGQEAVKCMVRRWRWYAVHVEDYRETGFDYLIDGEIDAPDEAGAIAAARACDPRSPLDTEMWDVWVEPIEGSR